LKHARFEFQAKISLRVGMADTIRSGTSRGGALGQRL